MSLGFSPEHASTLRHLIQKYFPNVEVLVFGSRITGKHKETSDIDVCLRSDLPLDLSKWAELDSDFTQSDLPFKVDIVDWSRISPEFQEIVSRRHLKLSEI